MARRRRRDELVWFGACVVLLLVVLLLLAGCHTVEAVSQVSEQTWVEVWLVVEAVVLDLWSVIEVLL